MRRLALASVCFLVCAAISVRAQAPPPNAPPSSAIASIKVTGAQKFPADQIITASGLKAGDVVTAAQIQDATNRLASSGLFSSVNFHYTAKGSAINLEFVVQEAPAYPIVFDNFPWLTNEEIAAAIRNHVGLFTGEAPGDGTLIEAMTAVIEDLLVERKIKGNVTHQLISAVTGDGMVMQFRLDGAPLRVQSVQFGDAAAAASERLKDRVPDIKGQTYSLFATEVFANEQVRPIYAEKGYLRAAIGPPQPHLIPDMNDPKQSAVDLSIPIDPGPVYLWKGVSWRGNMAVQSPSLDANVPLKPGDVADGMKIEALWQKIESHYGKEGYLDMKLATAPQFDDAAHQVAYQATISEGPQYRMGELVISGLSLDAEKRLRQAWQIAPGQIFDDGYYESHLKILSKPSRDIFGDLPVHYNEFGHLLRPDTTRHTVDVLLDFK
ncbi:MAG TPA: POTRA domain-containing protein [Candidatus Acidoferrales bacterium]|jgi:outer membrane protein assembly factor BamA|nr:POTRA domain-containing protein [Candidatus Acidoferrales bacterium]